MRADKALAVSAAELETWTGEGDLEIQVEEGIDVEEVDGRHSEVARLEGIAI